MVLKGEGLRVCRVRLGRVRLGSVRVERDARVRLKAKHLSGKGLKVQGSWFEKLGLEGSGV